MHTTIEANNPFGCDRYGFAWEHVPTNGATHLDFGCGDGRLLAALKRKGKEHLVGVEVSAEAVTQAARRSEELEIRHIRHTVPLPFADGAFCGISLLDVLEHVDEQGALLEELHRVLDDDGTLIVTVPGRYAFSFLDMGNFKFRFPRLHRWYYCRTHSPEEYEHRYVAHPDGLVGDVSAQKRWHEHFSRRALAELLSRYGFSVVQFDGAGFFVRILKMAEILLGRIGPLRSAISTLIAWDARCFASANLFCVARKSPNRSVNADSDSFSSVSAMPSLCRGRRHG
jgi:SAM-dependent methyltransferase